MSSTTCVASGSGRWLCSVLTGGTAYALDGQNTVFSDDIVNGEVKVADIGQGAVATDEIGNGQVKAADIGDGEVKSAEIANGQVLGADIGAGEVRSGNVANDNLTGGDIAGNSLKGADIDEATLDVGDAARAYAEVDPFSCANTFPGACTPTQSKGISSVIRETNGEYCVTAPGIDTQETPAAVTVDWSNTLDPEGNASAFTRELAGCGPGGHGFVVQTERHPEVVVLDTEGIERTVAGNPDPSNDVGFTIVIP